MSMHAQLDLDFVRTDHTTRVRCLRQDPPWKIIRGFPLDHGESLVHLNNVSGGIFGGDSLHLSARLHPGASAQITTTGATRVYRPRPAAPEATLRADFHLAPDATLEYLPDAIIPFRHARVLQHSTYTLAEGAALFFWDSLAPGRTASGELFAYDRVRIASEITVCGRPVSTDRLLLEPALWPVHTPARFGPFPYLVTFVALRAGTTSAEVRHLEQTLLEIVSPSDPPPAPNPPSALWGVTPLPAHGVLVRGLLTSGVSIPSTLHTLWNAARQLLSGRPATPPRKTY